MFHRQRLADEVQCRCWRAAASGQLSGSWTQIWLRHGARPILLSEPVSMSHNQLPPPQQCREWSDDEPDGWALEFMQQFQELCTCGSPCVFVVVNWYAIGLEPGMPLKHLCTTQALVAEALLNHFEGFCSTFPKIGTKYDAHSLFLSLIHRDNRHGSCTRLQINACKNLILSTWNLDADSLNMVVLPSTGALCYHNCCIDGGTSQENSGSTHIHACMHAHAHKHFTQDTQK